MKTFSFIDIWNDCVEMDDSRPVEPRERLFASELGSSMVDVFLKLKGTIPTNPPNNRSRRKFNAGNLTEWIVKVVLLQAGILLRTQKALIYQYPGLLPVSGKLDFIMGGRPDFERSLATIASYKDMFPPFVLVAMEKVIKQLEGTLGTEELKKLILEIKSTSSMMLEKYMRTETPQPTHVSQIYHYLKASEGEFDEGRIVYICRDDLHCIEFAVSNNGSTTAETNYHDFIQGITDYYKANTRPPLEPELKFEDFRFGTNFKVEYSNFLTMLYGYDRPDTYRDKYKKMIPSFNRTFKRCVNGDKMTKLNLDTIKIATEHFPAWDEYVQLGQKNKELIAAEDGEENSEA